MVIKREGQQQKQDSFLAPWSTQNCALKRFNLRVVATPSRRNLASVEAMKGVGREAHNDDKLRKTMSTDGYHTRRWAASWSETSR